MTQQVIIYLITNDTYSTNPVGVIGRGNTTGIVSIPVGRSDVAVGGTVGNIAGTKI